MSRKITHFRVCQDSEQLPFRKGDVVEVVGSLSGQGPVRLAGTHWTGAPCVEDIPRPLYVSLRNGGVLQEQRVNVADSAAVN